MMRRVLILVGGLVVGLAVVVVAIVAGILGTGPGHAVARRLAVGALAGAVDGQVKIGSISGSLWHAAELRDVELSTPDGRPVIRVGRARVTYALADLARRRYELSHVELDRPTITLEEGPDGRLNIERLFRLGGPKRGPPGRRAFVELRGVHITNGTVILREGADTAGKHRVRRFLGLDLEAGRVRASHPDSAALTADIRHLSVAISDPATRVVDAAGRVVVEGDSVRFDLSSVELARTRGRARGTVRLGKTLPGRPTVDVAADLPRVGLGDFRWAVAGLPEQGSGSAAVHLTLLKGGGTLLDLRNVDIREGRSHLRGGAELVFGPRGGVKIDSLDAVTDPLDLALLEPFLGKLPVSGTVAGRLRGTGTLSSLAIAADLSLTDEGVASHPVTRFAGAGVVTVGGHDVVAFHQFTLAGSDLALGTIEKLAPPVTLQGHLALDGRLDGPWRDATFDGTIRHTDGEASSRVRGTTHLTLADPVRVAADVVTDSLSLDDLAQSYPALPLRGTLAGTVKLDGPVGALAVDAAFQGPGGGIRARGVVGASDSGVELRFSGSLDSLDLSGRLNGAPATRLSGEWRADVAFPADSGAPATGAAAVHLTGSRFAGVELARAAVAVRLTPERLEMDTVQLEQPGLSLVVSGALGRGGQPAGQLSFTAHSDTMANLEPLVSWLRGLAGADSASRRLAASGVGRVSGRLTGTLDSWEVQGDLFADSVSFGTLAVQNGRASGSVRRTPDGLAFALRAHADTLDVGALAYADVDASATGPLDSLRLTAGASFEPGSSVRLDVEAARDTAGWNLRLDRATLRLPERAWQLVGTPRLAVTRDWVALDTIELRAAGGGRFRAAGRIPLEGAGDAVLEMDSVPLDNFYALAQQDTSELSGALTATVHVSGRAADPVMKLAASLADGQVGDFHAPLVEVAADYARKRLTFSAGLKSEREQVLTASGSLPLDLALTGVERRQLPDSLRIRIRADSVDLSAVDALTALVRGVHGQLTADVEVRGTWDRPLLEGSARIAGGAATIPALGARYSGIDARMTLAGDRLHVDEARLGGGTGALTATGDVVFERLTQPVLDLQLAARGFAAFTQRDFAGLTASGSLSLTGPLNRATLSGAVTVDAGFLAFADLVEKRIVNLDDPEFRAVVDSNLMRASDLAPSASNVFLDSLRIRSLTVSMGPDVWLRSHEANIQLAGDFTVTKDVEEGVSRYRMDGELRAVRGTYRLVVGPTSKEFRVTRGTVRFFGTPDLNPVLDIVAEHSVRAVQGNDLVVRAVIGGTLLVPRLSLESDQRPPLSETEIVSYLLFGRPSFDLVSGGQGSRSEQAIFQGALSGLAGVLSGELEQTLVADLGIPVDYIAIRPGGGTVGDIFGSTRVEAGTQIGERTFLTLNAGFCQVTRGPSSQTLGASVEYRMTRRWSMEASVEPTVQQCRPNGFQIRPPAPYQFGFDLFWQSGVP